MIGNLTVAADVIFVNIISLVVSVPKGVHFKTVEYVSLRLKTILANSMGKIFEVY